MSSYGVHPVISKEEAKRLLPARACKLCVYKARYPPSHRLLNSTSKCDRCGITQAAGSVLSFNGVLTTNIPV